MKIAFIGCVDFSRGALEHLLDLPQAQVVGLVTLRWSLNSDFSDLAVVAESAGIPVLFADGREQSETAAWLKALAADVVYCFGWSSLLKRDILDAAPLGVVGFHPAALPYNRGRHPLIWALALGLEETASTFFFMDEGADTGDIISQVAIEISPDDDAGSLYRKMTHTALGQITEITAAIANGRAERRPQLRGLGNVWRKRGRLDGQIDWRMSGRAIHNLVRALTRPYVGAHCLYGAREIKVWRTKVVDWPQQNIEPGKVLGTNENGVVLVKCDGGAVALLAHGFDRPPQEGTYL
jgi:methionyl-tRNA formyltransferase